MTIGLWGPADAVHSVAMFPIIPHHVCPLLRGPTLVTPRSSASRPSPAASPVLASGGCYHPGSPAAPPSRATSTPLPLAPPPPACPSPPTLSPGPPPPRAPGVTAAEDLPARCATSPFQPEDVLDADAMLEEEDDEPAGVQLRLSAAGRLEASLKGSRRLRWVRRVRLADDCHSANLQVQRGDCGGGGGGGAESDRLRLATVRPVTRGQPLQLWFADDLLAGLHLPFLAPHNIQGEKQYVCHMCGRAFEFPNPLKLHLALDCGRQDVEELWQRLAGKKASAFRPYCNTSLSSSFSSSGSSSSGSASSNGSLFNSFHHLSILAPHGPLFGPPPPPGPLGLSVPLGLLAPPPPPALRPDPSRGEAQHQSYHQHASDMETLVSNLGRSKQGHLCIYCGKVYSRKYGLKIHIRTHTGFKPLKCKYCLRPFGDPSNLNKHVRLHAEGDTPYKCELCGKVLVRRRDLERHVKSRHQEGDWDPDNDQDDDVEVDVDEDTNDDEDDRVLCNSSSKASLSSSRPDIPIPTV